MAWHAIMPALICPMNCIIVEPPQKVICAIAENRRHSPEDGLIMSRQTRLGIFVMEAIEFKETVRTLHDRLIIVERPTRNFQLQPKSNKGSFSRIIGRKTTKTIFGHSLNLMKLANPTRRPFVT